jgi:hypothetical protein
VSTASRTGVPTAPGDTEDRAPARPALGSRAATPAHSANAVRAWLRVPSALALLDVVLVLAGLAALFLLPPSAANPVWVPEQLVWHDGVERYEILRAFVAGRPIGQLQYVDPAWSGRWPLIGTLLATPLWYLGSVIKSPSFWLARYNWMLFSGALAAIYLLLRKRVDTGLLRTFLLVLVTGSLFASHLASYLTFEPFTAALVAVGAVALGTGRAVLGWALIVLGVANMPALLVGLGLAVLVHVARTRQLRHLAVPVVALALVLVDNQVRTGHLQPSAYAMLDRGWPNGTPYSGLPGFSYPFLFGLLALLLSFGRGLVFYTPGLFVPIRASLRRISTELWTAYLLLAALTVGLVLVYARWWGWDGGFFWGPRFFLLATVPASLAVAVRLHHRSARVRDAALNLGLVALCGWVAISGAAFGMSGLPQCDEVNRRAYQCDFVVTLSPLWHPFVGSGARAEPGSLPFVVVVLLAVARLGAPSVVTLARAARQRASTALAGRAPLAGWRI